MGIVVEDPVCSRKFALENAIAAEEYKGWTYFFCSSECQDKFNKSPSAFANGPVPTQAK
jgi:Cu+-exporting ATPase